MSQVIHTPTAALELHTIEVTFRFDLQELPQLIDVYFVSVIQLLLGSRYILQSAKGRHNCTLDQHPCDGKGAGTQFKVP